MVSFLSQPSLCLLQCYIILQMRAMMASDVVMTQKTSLTTSPTRHDVTKTQMTLSVRSSVRIGKVTKVNRTSYARHGDVTTLATISETSSARHLPGDVTMIPKNTVPESTSQTVTQSQSSIVTPSSTKQRETSTLGTPIIEYLGFFENPASSTAKPDDQTPFNGFVLWVSLLGVGSFLTGIIIASFVAYGFYKKFGCKCRWTCRASAHAYHQMDLENPRSALPAIENDLLRYRHDDIRPTYTILPTSIVEHYIEHCQSLNNNHHSSYKGLDNPWITQFHQVLTQHHGGDVTHPHSDVIVTIPPDSFERFPRRPIYVNVAMSGDDFNLDVGPTDIQLTPIVEVISVGVQQFMQPITVRIPHRAHITDYSQWHFNLYYSVTPLGQTTKWHRTKLSGQDEVTFTLDANYVYIKSRVAGTFVCAGMGRKQATLRACAVSYVNWQVNSHHLQLSVYICDNYTDMHKYIYDIESGRDAIRASHHQSLSVYNMKDWLIKLHSAASPVWPWAELDDDCKQAISMNEIVRRPVAPSSVTFRLRCKDSNRKIEDFQATVTIGQVRKDPSRMDNMYLVTRHIPLQEIPRFSMAALRRKSVHEPEDDVDMM